MALLGWLLQGRQRVACVGRLDGMLLARRHPKYVANLTRAYQYPGVPQEWIPHQQGLVESLLSLTHAGQVGTEVTANNEKDH